MDVNVFLRELLVGQTGKLRVSLEVLIGNRGGLLHHVTEVPGHGEHAFSFADGTLDEQNLSTHLRPCKSGDHAGGLVPALFVMEGSRQTEILLQVSRLDCLRALLIEGNLLRTHAGNLRNLFLKASHSGFPCVFLYDCRQGRFADLQLIFV